MLPEKRISQLLAFFFFAGLLILPVAVRATSAYQVGVKVGGWATYRGSLAMLGNVSLVPGIPGGFMPSNSTNTVASNITGASGPNVYFTNKMNYANGTSAFIQSAINVTVGWGVDGPPFIIAGGLYQGNPLGTDTSATLNQTQLTILRLTPGGSSKPVNSTRIVNYLSISLDYISADGSSSNSTSSRYGWDRTTGVLVSVLIHDTYQQAGRGSADLTYSLTMASTNLWALIIPTPPGMTVAPPQSPSGFTLFGLAFPELYVLAGVFGATGTVIFAMIRRKPRSKGKTGVLPRNRRRLARGRTERKNA